MISGIGGTWLVRLRRIRQTNQMPYERRLYGLTKISDSDFAVSYSLVSHVQTYGNNNTQPL